MAIIAFGTLVAVRASAANEADYDALIARAVAAYQAGDFGEAFEHFTAAHALNPNARTHRGLAITALRLDRPALALFHLRSALLETRRPLSPSLRASVVELSASTELQVARVEVRHDSGTELRVDGAAPLIDPENQDVLLSPGHHRLTAIFERGQRLSREIDVTAGARLQLEIEPTDTEIPKPRAAFADLPAPVGDDPSAAPAPTSEPATLSEKTRLPTGPIALASVGGAALLGAAVTGGLALSEKNALEQGCDGDDCDARYSIHQQRGRRWQRLTNGMLVVGGSAVVGGFVWWLLLDEEEPKEPNAQVSFGTNHCFVQVQGKL